MFDVAELFERQRQWQRSRARLSWSEKLALAEVLRDAALAFGARREDVKSRSASDHHVGTSFQPGKGPTSSL